MEPERELKPWWMYVVACADGSLYCGATPDVEKRIAKHNLGKGAKYTKVRLPVRLVHSERCDDRSAALKREWEFKQLSRNQKMKVIQNPRLPLNLG
jgi:putative endonuclease